MKQILKDKSRILRRERNADLIGRINSGEPTSQFNSFSSWYPPRPVIEKNGDAIEKLYGVKPISKSEDAGSFSSANKRVPLRLA